MVTRTQFLSPPPFIFNKLSMFATSRSVNVRTSSPVISEQLASNSSPPSQSLVAVARPILVAKNLGLQPNPELGFLSHLSVLSMAFAAFFSAFGRLGASVNTLSKVVSEEVPGTLSSLKLSTMELNELTRQLSSLRHKISDIPTGSKNGSTAKSRSFRKKNPAS
ncbi:hypothetical protein Fmac_021020 [Flemingia macrophylla]|uniref:Uncharacterized protein n=1 Tax=Flemingia macrophylla TaxID=520843 RepID=A0ABD1LVQ2_9FABA